MPSLPPQSRPQRQIRVRVVLHAGEVHYDPDGCYGEALDIAFRLLDAPGVKRTLKAAPDPLILVVSGEIYSSVARHGYDQIDGSAFHRLVTRQIAGNRYPGMDPNLRSGNPAARRRTSIAGHWPESCNSGGQRLDRHSLERLRQAGRSGTSYEPKNGRSARQPYTVAQFQAERGIGRFVVAGPSIPFDVHPR